jgi:type I restriction enzyme, R subunit
MQDALDNYQVHVKGQSVEFSDKILTNVPVDQLHAMLDNSLLLRYGKPIPAG